MLIIAITVVIIQVAVRNMRNMRNMSTVLVKLLVLILLMITITLEEPNNSNSTHSNTISHNVVKTMINHPPKHHNFLMGGVNHQKWDGLWLFYPH